MTLLATAIPVAESYPGLISAFDFSLTDAGTMECLSVAGSRAGGKVVFSGVETINGSGVQLGALQSGVMSHTFNKQDPHLIFVVASNAPTFELWKYQAASARSGVIGVIDATLSFRYQSAWNSQLKTATHSGSVPVGELAFISCHFKNQQSTGHVTLGIGSETEGASNNGATYQNFDESVHTLFGEGFKGRAVGLFVYDRELTPQQLTGIFAEIGIYGNVSLASNLNPSLLQSGVVLRQDRTIDATFSVPAGGESIEFYSASASGELLQLYAFDSDELGTVYRSQPIDPSLVSTIELEPVGAAPDSGAGSQAAKVSGIVQIEGTPAERTVRAFSYNPTAHDLDGSTVNLSKSLGHATSDGTTGEYTIDLLGGYGREVFVVAFDDYGAEFSPELALNVGNRIHPTTPNGHVFECTGAGTLPATEPAWVVDTETALLYGTAAMIARPFYRPMVHGPVTPEAAIPTDPILPTVIGEPFGGGFYAGEIAYGGNHYKLIVADKEADVYGLAWKTENTNSPGAVSSDDGYANTQYMAGNSKYQEGNHCLDYRGGEHSDWYMPALNELLLLYQNLGLDRPGVPASFASGAAQAFDAAFYRPSTQTSGTTVPHLSFASGGQGNYQKNFTQRRVRPIRRIEFIPEI